MENLDVEDLFKIAKSLSEAYLHNDVVKTLEKVAEKSDKDIPDMMKEMLSRSCKQIIIPLRISCILSKNDSKVELSPEKYEEYEELMKRCNDKI